MLDIYQQGIKNNQGNLKGGIKSLFDPCVNAMGRRAYQPSHMEMSYCTFGFGVNIQRYQHTCHYRVIHRAITVMSV